MSLPYEEVLFDRVSSLRRDVGPMKTVCGVGFLEKQELVLEKSLAHLQGVEGAKLADFRNLEAASSLQKVIELLPSHEVIAVCDLHSLSDPLIKWLNAIVARREEFDLKPGLRGQRQPNQSLYLVVNGALPGKVPSSLDAAPYWDFVGV